MPPSLPAPQVSPLPRRRLAVNRLAITLGAALVSLSLVAGCSASLPEPMGPSAPMGARAEMAPPPMAAEPAAAAPMAPSPAQASTGYASPSADVGMPADSGTDEEAGAPSAAPAQAPARAPAAAPRPAAAKAAPPSAAKVNAPVKAPPGRPQTPPTPAKAGEKAERAAEQAPATPARPMLIYVGNLRLQVEGDAAIPTTIDKIIDIAEGLGGYLVGRKDTSVEVRIPSQYFRDGFTQIEKLAEVLGRSVSADDVSEQYHDLEVRLSNLKATQKRLQEFLAKAGTMADMLTVGRELERVSAEIDQISGKMRFLRSRAAFSLVTVQLQAKPKPQVIADSTRTPPPPPPPRELNLPVPWLPRVGLDALLDLH